MSEQLVGAPSLNPLETMLYALLKVFLEAQGFTVKGELCSCDIVAARGEEPPLVVIVEMKLSFTLELMLQAVDHLAVADEVWLAVAAGRRGRDQDRRVLWLCRLLRLGIVTVSGYKQPKPKQSPLH